MYKTDMRVYMTDTWQTANTPSVKAWIQDDLQLKYCM